MTEDTPVGLSRTGGVLSGAISQSGLEDAWSTVCTTDTRVHAGRSATRKYAATFANMLDRLKSGQTKTTRATFAKAERIVSTDKLLESG
jgi:hypothetical protein